MDSLNLSETAPPNHPGLVMITPSNFAEEKEMKELQVALGNDISSGIPTDTHTSVVEETRRRIHSELTRTNMELAMKLAEQDRSDMQERANEIVVNVVKGTKRTPEEIAKQLLAAARKKAAAAGGLHPTDTSVLMPKFHAAESSRKHIDTYIVPAPEEINQDEFDRCLGEALIFLREMLGRRVMARSARGTADYRPFFSLNWCINTCLQGKGSFRATNLGKNLRRRTGLGAKFQELKCESPPDFDIPRKDIIFVDRSQMGRCLGNLYANPNVKELSRCRGKIEKVAVRLIAGCPIAKRNVEEILRNTELEVKKSFEQFLEISKEDVNVNSGKDPLTRLKCAGMVNSREGLRPCKSFPVRGTKYCKIHIQPGARGSKRKGERGASRSFLGRKKKQRGVYLSPR